MHKKENDKRIWSLKSLSDIFNKISNYNHNNDIFYVFLGCLSSSSRYSHSTRMSSWTILQVYSIWKEWESSSTDLSIYTRHNHPKCLRPKRKKRKHTGCCRMYKVAEGHLHGPCGMAKIGGVPTLLPMLKSYLKTLAMIIISALYGNKQTYINNLSYICIRQITNQFTTGNK